MSFNRFSPEPSLPPRLPSFAINPQPVNDHPVFSLFDLTPNQSGFSRPQDQGKTNGNLNKSQRWDSPFKVFQRKSDSSSRFCRKAFRKSATKYHSPPQIMSLFINHKTSSAVISNPNLARKCKSAVSKAHPSAYRSPSRPFKQSSENFNGSLLFGQSPQCSSKTPWNRIRETRMMFEQELENSPLWELSVACQPLSMLKLGGNLSFKCFCETEKQRRSIDIIFDKKLIKIAKKIRKIEFEHIQKSEVHVLQDQKIVVVNYKEGYSLSEFIGDHIVNLGEHLIRALLRDVLMAILYLHRKTGCDFSFSEHDVIIIPKNDHKQSYKFKLANVILQNLSLGLHTKRYFSAAILPPFMHPVRSDLLSTEYPEKAIRCLGELAIGICGNRHGFKELQRNFKCPWISESLNDLIHQLAMFSSEDELKIMTILQRLENGDRMRLEWAYLPRLKQPNSLKCPKVKRPRSNSNPL